MPKKPTRGQEFKSAVLEEFDLGLDDLVLLDETADTIDLIDTLPASAFVEKRMQRDLLRRLTAQLNLAGDDVQAAASARGRAAANQRWQRPRAVK